MPAVVWPVQAVVPSHQCCSTPTWNKAMPAVARKASASSHSAIRRRGDPAGCRIATTPRAIAAQ